MRLRFTGFDDETDSFKDLFDLVLEKEEISASNQAGADFLNHLVALEKAGMGLADSKLLAAEKYEELFQFFKEHYHSLYLSASEV